MEAVSRQVVGVRLGRPGLQVEIMVRQIFFAGLVVLLPAGLQAQGRGAMGSVSHAAVSVAPRAVVQAPHAAAVNAMAGTRPVARSGAPRYRPMMPVGRRARTVSSPSHFASNQIGIRPGCNTAPGLGFDATHFAATCGSGTAGFRRGAFPSSFFFPFYEGGFYVPGAPAGVDDSMAAETVQPDGTDADARETGRRYRVAPSEAEPSVDTIGAEPAENDEYVFVRRDGTVFFAVAFSWEKGTLRYITSEGLKRTVTQDALDLDATRQFNEQRGLNFQSPA